MTPLLAISSGTVAVIVVIVVIDLFAIFFGLSFADRGRPSGRRTPRPAPPSWASPRRRRPSP